MITVFNVALAPYRIDFFNSLADMGAASFYFLQQGVEGSSFDEVQMRRKCRFVPRALKCFSLLGRRVPLKVWAILRKEKPRTVFVPEFSFACFLVLIYRLLFFAGFKVVSICDDSIDMLHGNDFSRLHGYARKLLAPLCDELVLLDNRAVEWYQQRYGKGMWFPMIRNDAAYAQSLCNAQLAEHDARSRFPEVNTTKVVLFVGRLVALKNVDTIINAMPEDALLVVVGDGEECTTLGQLAAGTRKQVLFVGWKNGDELLAWYRIAHVLVLASFREAFGAVVNEALLAGCRVCVSKRAGSACLVTPENGALFNPVNGDELSDKLRRELDAQPLKKAVKSLMHVDFDTFVEQLKLVI